MSPRLPAQSATPAEVRSYIARTLKFKHSATWEFASQKAELWEIGRGSELCASKRESLEKLFGVNVGLCLFQGIREDEDEDWQESKIGTYSLWFVKASQVVDTALFFVDYVPQANEFLPQITFISHLALGVSSINYVCRRPKLDNYMMLFSGLMRLFISFTNYPKDSGSEIVMTFFALFAFAFSWT
ncbi:hypothetical protein ASPZODRAFT_169935 [Penicilliopsis zonata CBS 506.65]|uniref:Uncharacterized protein n=1 Tax=Penicilliopsis zonata CBS 506.65 TaxID=1073090 RepID=A0A1L9S646_9EURO|nr:hypothetical protein ASPZODRAFT_169935 [Penicilliopsis zonata CBS 506.65]OJJ42641.1 hypothetical protein ASPZODRAFT_169935 [Penicilliopsis zonata CBS 506.65]